MNSERNHLGTSGSSRERGQSLVEFALVVPVFLLLMFGIIDFGRLFFSQMTLQHAMREAGRFGVTGRHLDDPNNPGTQLSRVNSIITTARNAASGLDITNIRVTSSSTGTNQNAGGPSDTMTVSITSRLRLITPMIGRYFGTNGVYTFTASTTFQNERFPATQAN